MSPVHDPLLIGFVEGKMEPALLEHGVGYFDFDEKYVHTRVLTWNALHDILTGDKSGSACDEQAEKFKLPVDALQRLTREKIQLHLLINSTGGKVFVGVKLKQIMAIIHEASGNTIAYGTDYVCSAAADLYGNAQQRYALRDSTFLFHGTRNGNINASMEYTADLGMRKALRQQRTEEMEAYKKMLLAQVKGENRKRVKWAFEIAIHNQENRLLDAYFRGEDLRGFVKTAFVQRRDLWNAFVRETGVDPDFAKDLFSAVRPFFLRVKHASDGETSPSA